MILRIYNSKNQTRVIYLLVGKTDNSLTGNSAGNTIQRIKSSNKLSLNFNTFGTNCNFNVLGFNK